jgi:hypothetical protein
MAAPGQHPSIELLDGLAARAYEKEGQQRVQHAGETGKDHPAAEIRSVHQALPVGFAYGLGVLVE